MSALRQVWRLLDARERRRLLRLQLLGIVMAGSTLSGVAAVLPFFAVLADPLAVDRYAVLAAFRDLLGLHDRRVFVLVLGTAFGALVAVSNLVNLWGTVRMAKFAHDVANRFHGVLLEEYLRRDYLFHARTGATTLSQRVLYSAVRVAGGVIESGMVAVTNAATVVLIFLAVLALNPLVALGALAWIGGGYAAIYWLARRKLHRNGVIELHHVAERGRLASESLRAVREVQLYGCQPHFRTALDAASAEVSRRALANLAIAHAPRYAMECFTVAGLIGTALYLEAAGASFGSWLAQLGFLSFAAYRLLPGIQQMFAALVRVRANSAALEEIAPDLEAAQVARHEPLTPPQAESWAGRPRREIALENIGFRYCSDRAPALHDVSLTIPAGALCAIVGANGAGKSTLVDVLLGLLVPEQGVLRVDGEVVDGGNRRAWQSRVAYVPQDIALFDTTLAANIALGVPPDQVDRARLQLAVRGASLDALVASLPRGLDEPLGDRGQRVSGGQRQRIGIARALYRGGSVLVMDEGTASLDGLTEQQILDLLVSLRGGRTIIVVAHRAETLRRCDLVFELDDGTLRRRKLPQRASSGTSP